MHQQWIPAYNFSITGYNGYAFGVCAEAGDPDCPCGTWQDTDMDGKTSSGSYHCGGQGPGVLAGGWENMDQGDGYYNGPVLPLGLTYNLTSEFGERVQRWENATGGIVVGATFPPPGPSFARGLLLPFVNLKTVPRSLSCAPFCPP